MKLLPRPAGQRRKFRPGLDHLRLVARLMRDPRVPWYLKLLPIIALVYFIAPDFFPTPIDDAVVLSVGIGLFLEFAPRDVVEEHRLALQGQPTVTGRVRAPHEEEDAP